MSEEKTRKTQILLLIPEDLLEKIDEYWHLKKYRSRAETIRELLKEIIEQKESQGHFPR